MPEPRLSRNQFLEYRSAVPRTDNSRELVEWARTVGCRVNAEELAKRLIGAIPSSGFSYETAMRISSGLLTKGCPKRTWKRLRS